MLSGEMTVCGGDGRGFRDRDRRAFRGGRAVFRSGGGRFCDGRDDFGGRPRGGLGEAFGAYIKCYPSLTFQQLTFCT